MTVANSQLGTPIPAVSPSSRLCRRQRGHLMGDGDVFHFDRRRTRQAAVATQGGLVLALRLSSMAQVESCA